MVTTTTNPLTFWVPGALLSGPANKLTCVTPELSQQLLGPLPRRTQAVWSGFRFSRPFQILLSQVTYSTVPWEAGCASHPPSESVSASPAVKQDSGPVVTVLTCVGEGSRSCTVFSDRNVKVEVALST